MTDRNPTLEDALVDLRAEGDYLDQVVSAPGADLARPTASPGWSIGHQLGHLTWTDRITILACVDPGRFRQRAQSVTDDFEAVVDGEAAAGASLATAELLDAWREARAGVIVALRGVPAGTRVPWIGTAMAAPTMVSARIMETWAHGVDISDALDLPPAATSRLRRVADLGVRTRDFAFRLHGLTAPAEPFRVELDGPDGERWAWGPADAGERIGGPALDFCLLVTQRRPCADLAVTASGSAARAWLAIAQTYAGPPGPGR